MGLLRPFRAAPEKGLASLTWPLAWAGMDRLFRAEVLKPVLGKLIGGA
jgi:hypothetical protein